ncbi:vinorine synthase-like [Papaver somniferum]|uniref:vinorine synthase-like n=1 Tax=Papaver somniferum TaxID=3469 RepID=UPI000E701293|nr:vinorine synthase-like [Papaver somniferum]
MNDTMKIEVVSKESIKPSFPTPNNVKTHTLSNLDQLFPPLYVDHLLYYPNLETNDSTSSLGDEEDGKNMIISVPSRRRCDVLKKSLAETLTRYYPLAGRIKDDKSVECNDEGVDYIEARVVGSVVSQVIQLASSDIEIMEPFLPYEPYGVASALRRGGLHLNSKALLKIQVNVSDCGGMVICLSYSHKIIDASSFANFVKDWTATARASSDTHDDELKVAAVDKSCYIFSSIFPPANFSHQEEKDSAEVQIIPHKIEILTKRFVFKDSSIATLKKKCIHVNSNNGSDQVDRQEHNKQQMPTRFEALTSFIWMCFMDVDLRFKVRQIDDAVIPDNAVKAVCDPKQVQYVASFPINLRTRTIPPLPDNTFGNMTDNAIVEVSRNLTGNNGFHDERQYYPELVSKIKDSIKLVDNEHVKAMKSNFAISCNHMKLHQMFKEGTSNDDHKTFLMFSSWCRFPIYEANFGWGKPSWASISKLLYKNCVMFIDTPSGDGIEAWVSLKEEDMVEFERHEELLALAS